MQMMIRKVMRPGVWLVVFCTLGACRSGFDEQFPTGPFTTREPIFAVEYRAAPFNDDDPTLPDDMLEIYFSSTRTTNKPNESPDAMNRAGDIWRSTRRRIDDPWGMPEPVDKLNDQNVTTDDQNPGISGDGLTLWFSSNRDHDGVSKTPLDIYVSTRASRDPASPWSTPTRVPELSTPLDELGAEPERPGLQRIALYADSPRRLFEATRPSSDAPWDTPPRSIDSLNDPGSNNLSGFFVTDLELWFASDRKGGLGANDIYRATRPSVDERFEHVEPVEGINGKARDDDPWLSPERHTLLFTSADSGNQEIYVATRP